MTVPIDGSMKRSELMNKAGVCSLFMPKSSDSFPRAISETLTINSIVTPVGDNRSAHINHNKPPEGTGSEDVKDTLCPSKSATAASCSSKTLSRSRYSSKAG